ncbi:MAG: EscU/YscU/HrcU family type III secretion system export apparatus switch protein [Thiomicrorhabdus sp.]|nr:EscU/YscU/HrcU family type III secretion system export apparatus switch protein [Thiomicrorhabdus sp.]
MKESKTLSDSFAISLEYEGSGAPKVTAKGRGYIAQEIINTAKELNIPIQSDPELVGLLSQVELNHEIPETLYEAVAQVLIFAYQISGKSPLEKPKESQSIEQSND